MQCGANRVLPRAIPSPAQHMDRLRPRPGHPRLSVVHSRLSDVQVMILSSDVVWIGLGYCLNDRHRLTLSQIDSKKAID
eukprot:2051911-Rhodomonas_salina.2